MLVIAHAADAIFFGPVLVVIVFISISAIRERRRERREAEQGGSAAPGELTQNS